MDKKRLLACLALLITSIIWGAAAPVIKFTLAGISALPFLAYRFTLSSAAALITLPWGGLKLPNHWKTILTVIIYGLLTSTVTLGLLFLGMERTTVLDAALISTLGPLMIVWAGEIFLKERVTHQEKTGIIIALVGTLLAVLEPFLRGGMSTIQLEGNILVLLYLASTTASAVLAKELVRQKVTPLALTNISFIIGFLTITPLAILSSSTPLWKTIFNLSWSYHLGVIFLALISGSLAYTLWARAQKTIEIGEAALFSYLYPIFSAPLAVFWLKEKITNSFALGAVLVTIGVLIAEYKRHRIAHLKHR